MDGIGISHTNSLKDFFNISCKVKFVNVMGNDLDMTPSNKVDHRSPLHGHHTMSVEIKLTTNCVCVTHLLSEYKTL